MRNAVLLLLSLGLAVHIPVCAQTGPTVKDAHKPEFVFNLGGWTGHVLAKPYWGLGMGGRFYPVPRFSAGLQLIAAFQRAAAAFQYTVADPVLEYGQVGMLVQYDAVQTPRFRAGLMLLNGFASARLGDKAEQQTYWNGHTATRRAREVATNYFYLFQPGVEVCYRIADGHHNSDLYLNAQGTYRILAGGTHFAVTDDFAGPAASIGISIIGIDTKRTSKKEAASPETD